MNPETRKKILTYLAARGGAPTNIRMVAAQAGITPLTAGKYVDTLEAGGEIHTLRIGNSRLVSIPRRGNKMKPLPMKWENLRAQLQEKNKETEEPIGILRIYWEDLAGCLLEAGLVK